MLYSRVCEPGYSDQRLSLEMTSSKGLKSEGLTKRSSQHTSHHTHLSFRVLLAPYLTCTHRIPPTTSVLTSTSMQSPDLFTPSMTSKESLCLGNEWSGRRTRRPRPTFTLRELDFHRPRSLELALPLVPLPDPPLMRRHPGHEHAV